MGKYDCTKAKDFLHEMVRIKDWCNDNCEKCSICNCPLCIAPVIYEWGCLSDKYFAALLESLQAWSDSHPERRELTGDEDAVLVGLKLLGFNYIASDINKKIWAYTKMPEKKDAYWVGIEGTSVCISYSGLFKDIADFLDEKPLVIDEILNERK
ncbi:MAG: hypothetical protein ACI4RH_07630 [Huintestinicola sp.]